MKISQVNPTPEAMKELLALPQDKPVTMLNILRYKDIVEETGETGKSTYKKYMKNALAHIQKADAKVIWQGNVSQMVIGDQENIPHKILLVQYPTPQHFLKMVLSPEYQKIAVDRTLALEYGGLVACGG